MRGGEDEARPGREDVPLGIIKHSGTTSSGKSHRGPAKRSQDGKTAFIDLKNHYYILGKVEDRKFTLDSLGH